MSTSSCTVARYTTWEVWCHPPYSPDLAPCDYHLFGPLKQDLGGQRFATDDEVQEAVSKLSLIHI